MYLKGAKSFTINHSTIATRNNTIAIGQEYQLKGGTKVDRVLIKNIVIKHYCIQLTLFLIDKNREIKVRHTLQPIAYSGMWRILNKNFYKLPYSTIDKKKELLEFEF